MPDLAADLDRIRRHIACVEAAATEPAPAALRAAVDVELAAWRLAAELAGHDRTASNDPDRSRTAPSVVAAVALEEIAACLDPREETPDGTA